MILVGTAGFRYADWKGHFYPSDLKDSEFLRYYARFFNVVELDYTYYRMPVAKTMAGLASRTPADFEFSVKANRAMTHEIPESRLGVREAFGLFMDAVEPLAATGRLACVLAQFPYSFKPCQASLDYLGGLKDLCQGARVVVEFRNNSWVSQETFDFLEQEGLGFCCVDEPQIRGLLPRVAVSTAGIAYVRFHGRNAAKWYHHDTVSERYDYLYSEEELKDWIPGLRKMEATAGKAYVLFNNCHDGKAARNSLMMKALLGLEVELQGKIELPGLEGSEMH